MTASEYDAKICELQSDLQDARKHVENLQEGGLRDKRELQQVIAELTDQNQRLTGRLKESAKTEEQLMSQIQSLREQFSTRRHTMQDHVSHLEIMREEINLLTSKKLDLESRIQNLFEEREGLSSTLEETSDRIVMLERHGREQEIQIRHGRRELEEMRVMNGSLTDQVETLSRSVSSPPSTLGHMSLQMELSENERPRGAASSSGHSSHSATSLPEEPGEDVECDDDIIDPVFPDREELRTLKQEVLSACQQARGLCDQVRHVRRRDSTSSSSTHAASSEEDSLTLADVKAGLLLSVVQELRSLVRDLLRREARGGGAGSCRSCGRHPQEIQELEVALHRAQEAGEAAAKQLAERTEQLKRKKEEAAAATGALSVRETELRASMEVCEVLRSDIAHSHASKDELIRKAWEIRDQSMARKNACEIELARTRVELMQANSQLMEVVQQKIELSQQLEQWQVDMHQLLEEQMRHKLTTEGKVQQQQGASDSDYSSSSGGKRKHSRSLFALFQR